MEFTKEQTNIAKGVAVCLLFVHHLFGFEDRFLDGNRFIQVIPFFNLEAEIAGFGNICVAMFVFLSGYGMYSSYLSTKQPLLSYTLKKLRNFYFTFWLYFLVFVPIGLRYYTQITIWGSDQVRFLSDSKIFLANFVGWSSSYNDDWWFVWTFICLLALFPLYAKLAQKNIVSLVFISLLLLVLSSKFGPYGHLSFAYWQTSFALGILCAKARFFSSNILIKHFDKPGLPFIVAWLILCVVLRRQVGGTRLDFLIIPFFIFFSCKAVSLLNLSKPFAYLGKYSFPLWLTHSFFAYYYFQSIVYYPKWSPFVFLALTTLSLLSVVGIEALRSYCLRVNKLIWRRI